MTKIQVLNGGWGEPSKKNVTQIGRITHEQWVYPNDRYVYFDDGIVTTVQKSE